MIKKDGLFKLPSQGFLPLFPSQASSDNQTHHTRQSQHLVVPILWQATSQGLLSGKAQTLTTKFSCSGDKQKRRNRQ